MKRSLVLYDFRICADGWLLWIASAIAALVLALALASTAAAQPVTYDWDNWSGNSEFHDAINWRPGGGPPGAVDSAIFDGELENLGIGNNGVHVINGSAISDMQVIDTAIVDLTIGNGTTSSRFDVNRTSGNSLVIGGSSGDVATLNLQGGWFDTFDTLVGGSATFNIINPGSYWDARNVLVSGDVNWPYPGIGLGLSAQVRTTTLDVGSDMGSGRVVVDGTPSGFEPPAQWTVSGSVDVGPTNTGSSQFGQVTLQDGGRMTVQDDVSVHGHSDDVLVSEISVRTGGELTVTDLLEIGPYGRLELSDATSKIATGRFSKTGTGGTFDWTGGTLEIASDHLILDSGTPDSVFGHDLTIGADKHLIVSLPDGENSLEIGRTGAGALTITNGGTVEAYRGIVGVFAGGSGTALVNGAGSTWTTHEGLRLGNQGSAIGTLTVQNYGTVHSDGWIVLGNIEQSRGTVIVEDFGHLSTDTVLRISSGGSTVGSLTVQSGGRVDVGDLLEVWDTGTVELFGGQITTGAFIVDPGGTFTHGDGTLTVNGGTFDPGIGIYFIDGTSATDLPTVQLDGGATASVQNSISVGGHHRGLLRILNGSRVELPDNGLLVIGDGEESQGEVVVDGKESTVIADQLVVGGLGPGVLRILSGGSAYVANSRGDYVTPIGTFDGSSGFIEVSGAAPDGTPSTCTTNGLLIVGASDFGTLVISAGGRVNALAGAGIAMHSGSQFSSARVTGSGSRWDITGALYVGGNDTSAGVTGKLSVQDDGLVTAGNIKVWQPGTVELDGGTISSDNLELAGGALRGSGEVNLPVSGSLHNAGLVSPGLSAGVIIVSSDYVQTAAGTLAVEIGGTSPFEYDQLIIINGSATLAGTLDVSFINLGGGVFAPSAGDTFEILMAAGGLGETTFDNIFFPDLGGGLVFGVFYNPTDVTLAVGGALGDYNLNGFVDAADYTVWRNTLHQSGSGLAADGNRNGSIDVGDYGVWKSHYGEMSGSGSGATAGRSSRVDAAIPEPATLPLLMLAAAGWFLRRRETS
jgi:T5SS/PEP-CTERM-associated repeat protein